MQVMLAQGSQLYMDLARKSLVDRSHPGSAQLPELSSRVSEFQEFLQGMNETTGDEISEMMHRSHTSCWLQNLKITKMFI
jgi:hypothetical protein